MENRANENPQQDALDSVCRIPPPAKLILPSGLRLTRYETKLFRMLIDGILVENDDIRTRLHGHQVDHTRWPGRKNTAVLICNLRVKLKPLLPTCVVVIENVRLKGYMMPPHVVRRLREMMDDTPAAGRQALPATQ